MTSTRVENGIDRRSRIALDLVDQPGFQVAASLMGNVEANVPSNDSDHTVAQRREHMMQKWMRY